jgi:hydroxymethylglutaryl-CoA lyase
VLGDSKTKLLAIVANTRGAEEAVQYEEISFLGFPFSISETFQLRNTNKTIAQSLVQVEEMQNLCSNHNKKMVLYISMGFGNPYGDEYNPEIVFYWFKKLTELGIGTIALADTVGLADPRIIRSVFEPLVPEFPQIEIGAHFHSTSDKWEEKIQTAFESGCMRFDSSLKGIGGCPMAEEELVGNIATENVVAWAKQKGLSLSLNQEALADALNQARELFI